jgi:hypothetical protein
MGPQHTLEMLHWCVCTLQPKSAMHVGCAQVGTMSVQVSLVQLNHAQPQVTVLYNCDMPLMLHTHLLQALSCEGLRCSVTASDGAKRTAH